jgi:hypothetical protein
MLQPVCEHVSKYEREMNVIINGFVSVAAQWPWDARGKFSTNNTKTWWQWSEDGPSSTGEWEANDSY